MPWMWQQHSQSMEKQSERLSLEAFTDPLTKVWNKRALNKQLSEVLTQPGLWPLSAGVGRGGVAIALLLLGSGFALTYGLSRLA